MSRTVFRSEKSIVDAESGEVKHLESINTIRLPEEPPYVKLYLDDLVRINDLPNSTSKILYQFVRKMNYDGQIILNAAVKRMIGSLINVKVQSISNAITSLIKKDIMQRLDTGIYVLN
ncbi:MAG TPA: replication/maintenance protein RepL, partial [Arsenophonus nasoniae]|uniref:replication/maintenance protein RepL n=1 Tax=Arsenophonus nasoniae TaxID=638 RepID=UPI00387906B9